jgi:ketosteroid isomerase-like protein
LTPDCHLYLYRDTEILSGRDAGAGLLQICISASTAGEIMSHPVAVTPEAQLVIERACERLAADYCYFADNRDFTAWANVFAEDGELIVAGKSVKGRTAIRQSVGGPESTGTVTVHSNSNLRIDVVSAEEARGTVTITAFAVPHSGAGPAMVQTITPVVVGTYRDVYRKTEEGWRIARREFVPTIARAQ